MFAKVGYSVILILCLSVGAIANVMNYAVVPAVWGAHRNAHVFWIVHGTTYLFEYV